MGVGLACGGNAGTHHLGVFFGHNVPMRFLPGCLLLLLATAFVVAGCGSEEPAVAEDPEPSAPIETTTPTSPTTEEVEPAPASTAPTTELQTTSTTTEPTIPEQQGFAVVTETDREALVTSVIVADDDGKILATVFDPESLGCEGFPADYFAVVGSDGKVTPGSIIGDEEKQYAGAVSASPNRQQLL
ncbi:MAG: hypothetical protein KJN63_05615, partial [Acidimicrobiia bacterium]|nr:hypothetical protein [Acidimicrobiia bacterium]